MRALIKICVFSIALALPAAAMAQPNNAAKSSGAMNCPMMADKASMQKDMGGMMSNMSAMMTKTSDPGMKDRMRSMHHQMAEMMSKMQKMRGGMADMKHPNMPPAEKRENHEIHHPNK
jgi:cystathionine beta-lyase/cystathionine gamma-synthase